MPSPKSTSRGGTGMGGGEELTEFSAQLDTLIEKAGFKGKVHDCADGGTMQRLLRGQAVVSTRVQASGHCSLRGGQPARSQEGTTLTGSLCFSLGSTEPFWSTENTRSAGACRARQRPSHLRFTRLQKRGGLKGFQDAALNLSLNLTVALANRFLLPRGEAMEPSIRADLRATALWPWPRPHRALAPASQGSLWKTRQSSPPVCEIRPGGSSSATVTSAEDDRLK
ncbi:unnamed protein product [Lota lota]